MTMKKKLLTALTLVVAAIALVAVTITGTIAYLTASSTVSNTFTVGDVFIEMFESEVGTDGKIPTTADTTAKKTSDGNSYHLVPGTTYDKDPTIYIKENSEPCYLFIKVINDLYNIEAGNQADADEAVKASTIAAQLLNSGWVVYQAGSTPRETIYVYQGVADSTGKVTSATPVASSPAEQQITLFKTFTIADDATNLAIYGGATITITAYAIQASELTVDAAWGAIVDVYPYESGVTTSEP